ncbi:MAG: hypothetical protein WDA42_03735 [Candidatus Bathyarchaeia archaeon]
MFALTKKKTLIIVIIIALALNTCIFLEAYPRTFISLDATFAADFSAYYIGEWRFFYNPTTIYEAGDYLPGDYVILPKPQSFMYTPSFLLFFAPFMILDYQASLIVFDMIQFLSMFALAFFVYKIVENKELALGCITAIVILLLPIPGALQFDAMTFFPGYYWGYALANAHVIQTTLIVASLYFGFVKKPLLSAFMLAVSSFDPRVTLLAFPILLWYNKGVLRKFVLSSIAFISVFNVPFFFYNNIGFTFLQKRATGDIIAAMYAYDWLPLVAVASITVVELITIIAVKSGYNIPKIGAKIREK